MVISGIAPEKFNTWGYLLTAYNGSNIVTVKVWLTAKTFNSHSTITISYDAEEQSRNAAINVQQKIEESLESLAQPIQPRDFLALMGQEWAKDYYPQLYYIPSPKISSIVRPYASQDIIPAEVAIAIAHELDIPEQSAMHYAKYVHSQIRLNLI